MKNFTSGSNRTGQKSHPIFTLAIFPMAGIAAARLLYEFWRLIFSQGELGAIDLRNFHLQTQALFGDFSIYNTYWSAVYPPASYLLLWPFIGWMNFETARWFWAVYSLSALVLTLFFLIPASRADSQQEKIFSALILLSMTATGTAIGNGQMTVLVLPLLLGAIFLIQKDGSSNWSWMAAVGLFLLALVKPTVSAPFFWPFVFSSKHTIRTAAAIVFCYLILNVTALLSLPSSFLSAYQDMMTRMSHLQIDGGYANLYNWFAAAGLSAWKTPCSLVLFAALGLWIFSYRRIDLWLQLGVTALIARFWAYHRIYDDVLLIIPMIALFKMLKKPVEFGNQNGMRVLFVLTLITVNFPGQFFVSEVRAIQSAVWIVLLTFFVYQAFLSKGFNGSS